MTPRISGRSFTRNAVQLWGGLLVWAAYFLVVYVVGAVACERDFTDVRIVGVGLVPFAGAAGLFAALAATAALARSAWRRARTDATHGGRFVGALAWTLSLLTLLALAWVALPPLLLRTGCA